MKVLIVGGGGIGERHLCCLLATGRAHVSICEAREERLEFLRAKYQIQETYTDFFDIPLSQYQGVIIATPAHLHIPMAMECAKVGVPFLVEKPLSVDLNGVDQLIALVDEKGIQAGVAYMRRNLPSYKKLREHAESGLIGEVKMGRFNSSQNYRKYRPDYKEIYYAKEDQEVAAFWMLLPISLTSPSGILGSGKFGGLERQAGIRRSGGRGFGHYHYAFCSRQLG